MSLSLSLQVLNEIVLKWLEKEAEERFRTVAELRAALPLGICLRYLEHREIADFFWRPTGRRSNVIIGANDRTQKLAIVVKLHRDNPFY